MPDEITCTVTVDLHDLHRYRQTGEDDYEHTSVTLVEAIVLAAVDQLIPKLVKDELLVKTRDRITADLIRTEVQTRITAALSKPIRKTNDWGEPTGPETTLTSLIDTEIAKQLTRTVSRSGYRDQASSTLDTVIKEVVSARLEADLKAAFNTARQAMIDAAAETGKKALAAAVAQALPR